jgi:tetratricopeptide (TPR) repeat protein
MNVPATEIQPRSRTSSRARLIVLLLLGAVALAVSIGVRRSSWAKERQLRNLSVEELALAIHDDPNDALTFVYYGSALLKAGDLPDGETAFRRAIHLDSHQTRAHLGLASVLLREGQLREAKDAFESTLRLDPKEADAYMGLSQTYYRAGSPRLALDPLKKLTQLQPKNAMAWYYLGKIYGDDHQPALSMEALKKATALQPNQADFWRDLGQVTGYYAHFAEAEQAYKRALALNANDAATHYLLGLLYMGQNDTPALRSQAKQEFETAIRLDPQLQKAYFTMGQLYERAADWNNAVLYYRKAQELDPGDYQALYHLGLCTVKTGKTAEGKKLIAASQELGAARRAMDDLNNRILTDPQNRELHLQLARTYRKYGNDEGALTQYTIYQRMGTSSAEVAGEIERFQAAHKPTLSPAPTSPPPASGTP